MKDARPARERRVLAIAAVAALAACGSRTPGPAAHAAAPAPRDDRRDTLSPELVIAKARSATGIQRCYTRYLKHAGGRGRVLVSFTVDTQGRAQDGVASGVPAPLGDCITAEVARWRFPAPNEARSFALPIDLVSAN